MVCIERGLHLPLEFLLSCLFELCGIYIVFYCRTACRSRYVNPSISIRGPFKLALALLDACKGRCTTGRHRCDYRSTCTLCSCTTTKEYELMIQSRLYVVRVGIFYYEYAAATRRRPKPPRAKDKTGQDWPVAILTDIVVPAVGIAAPAASRLPDSDSPSPLLPLRVRPQHKNADPKQHARCGPHSAAAIRCHTDRPHCQPFEGNKNNTRRTSHLLLCLLCFCLPSAIMIALGAHW